MAVPTLPEIRRTIGRVDPTLMAAREAIHAGDVERLERLLAEHPALATARITDDRGHERTLLHVATDWPGHFPRGADTVAALVAAGADTGAAFVGPHAETPLHWAASSDDVEVLDALVAAGADVDAPGSVIDGGGPLSDAVAFAQWRAARRLVEHGARPNLWQAAGLGLEERVEVLLADASPEDVTNAFWCACHGGQRAAAQRLLAAGADLNWAGHDDLTPLGAAERSGAADLAAWLRARGAR
jgi:hypothetical protein